MSAFPRPIAGSNSGDGSPLVLGDESVVGDLFTGGSQVQVLDWDGDGEREIVASGGNGDIYSYKIIDAIADGTPIVDRGLQWGRVSRALHRNERDDGLVGNITVAADFDGDGRGEVILTPRGYSLKSTVAICIDDDGPPATRDEGRPVPIVGGPAGLGFGRGNVAVVDWNADGTLDLVVLESGKDEMWAMHEDGTVPEDQRDRYDKDGRYFSSHARRLTFKCRLSSIAVPSNTEVSLPSRCNR